MPFFKRNASPPPGGPPEWLIVGLGNAGPKYAGTRHNVGFEVINRLSDSEHIRLDTSKFNAIFGRGSIEGVPLALVKPMTMMNLSGKAVAPLANFYKIPPEQVLVIYDDLDLPTGQLRLRYKGGPGGHNGMRSLIQHLGTKEFPRLRIGIDRPPGRMDPAAYVLQKFSQAEAEEMAHTYPRAADAVRLVLRDGIELAMNQVN